MSTELYADDDAGLYVVALWGGDAYGPCVQITTTDPFDTGRAQVTLTLSQVREVHHALVTWIGDQAQRALDRRRARGGEKPR